MNYHDTRIYQLGEGDSKQTLGMGQGQQTGHGVGCGKPRHGHGRDIDGNALPDTCQKRTNHTFDDM